MRQASQQQVALERGGWRSAMETCPLGAQRLQIEAHQGGHLVAQE
jgi:hypothetical protein